LIYGLKNYSRLLAGSYAAFMRWRVELAEPGLPPLELMEGFWFIDKPVTGIRSGAVMRRTKSAATITRILCGALPISWSV